MPEDTVSPKPVGSLLNLNTAMQGGNLAVLVGFALVVRDASDKEMKVLEETQISVVKLVSKVDRLGEQFDQLQEEMRALKARVEAAPTQDDISGIREEISAVEHRLELLERCARNKRECREI